MSMQKDARARPVRFVKSAGLWQRIANVPAVQPSDQPALKNVRGVNTALAGASLGTKQEEAHGEIQLLFDSFSQRGFAGTRSGPTRVRQLLYRAEPYQIDLHIELIPESNRLAVSGQLVDISHQDMFGRDVQVVLSDGREYILNTLTNQFGEFSFEVRNTGELELSFLGRAEKPIVILLLGVLDPFPHGGE
jgi:hypothetical protein